MLAADQIPSRLPCLIGMTRMSATTIHTPSLRARRAISVDASSPTTRNPTESK
jgi:hypothetical protein